MDMYNDKALKCAWAELGAKAERGELIHYHEVVLAVQGARSLVVR